MLVSIGLASQNAILFITVSDVDCSKHSDTNPPVVFDGIESNWAELKSDQNV